MDAASGADAEDARWERVVERAGYRGSPAGDQGVRVWWTRRPERMRRTLAGSEWWSGPGIAARPLGTRECGSGGRGVRSGCGGRSPGASGGAGRVSRLARWGPGSAGLVDAASGADAEDARRERAVERAGYRGSPAGDQGVRVWWTRRPERMRRTLAGSERWSGPGIPARPRATKSAGPRSDGKQRFTGT